VCGRICAKPNSGIILTLAWRCETHNKLIQNNQCHGSALDKAPLEPNFTTMLDCSWKPLYGTGNTNNAISCNKILSHFAKCSVTNACIRCTVPTEISYGQWTSRTQLQCHMMFGWHGTSL